MALSTENKYKSWATEMPTISLLFRLEQKWPFWYAHQLPLSSNEWLGVFLLLLLLSKHCRTAILSSESVAHKSFGWLFNKHLLFSVQGTTVVFVRLSWHSNVISMDIAVCSCRNKTNTTPTSHSRTWSGMQRPWELSFLSVSAASLQLSFGKELTRG